MKPTILCAVLATSILPACATDDGAADELAGETSADGESGKGDAADAFTYFQVTPETDGFSVSRVNRASTTCVDGTSAASCKISSIDWSRSRLSDTASFESKLRDGAAVLLRGDLALDTGVLAAKALASNASSLLVPAQPMIDVGGGPDCLYAKLTVTNVTATASSITVLPSNAVSARFDGVTITATSDHAVACVNGTAAVTIKLAEVDVTGTLAAAGLTSPTVHATGMTVDAPQLPGPVYDMLDLDANAPAIVSKTASLALASVATATPGASLSASEVWLPGSDTGEIDGVFVLAKDNDARCITAPCPSIGEMRLNSSRNAAIDSIDFSASGADTAAIDAAQSDVATTGVLLVGNRYYTDGGRGKGRRANQFWTKARP